MMLDVGVCMDTFAYWAFQRRIFLSVFPLFPIYTQTQSIINKCTISTSVNSVKVYLGTAEGDFKKRLYDHTKSFRNKRHTNDRSLSKYIWKIKEKHQENPSLKWLIIKSVPTYFNIAKKCLLCLHEKLKLLIAHTLKNC